MPDQKATRQSVDAVPAAAVVDGTVPGLLGLDDPRLYINRELSLLQFQHRVLEEAQDPRNRLLERVKFLAIVGSNLDEFFMVRVGGLRMQLEAGVIEPSIDGLTPAEQLAAIRKAALPLMTEARACLRTKLLPQLNSAGIHIRNYDQLNARQRSGVAEFFRETIFPVLTPLAFDPGRPFPHISNLSLNLAITIRDEEGRERFARVKVPSSLPRLVPVRRSSGGVRRDGTVPHHHYFVWLEQVIMAHLPELFPGMEVVEAHPFRVIRNADLITREMEADDLLATMEQSVRERRFGAVVEMTHNPELPRHVRALLIENLEMDPLDVYAVEGPLGFGDLIGLYTTVERYDLKDPPVVPAVPRALAGATRDTDIFAAIRQQDILLHHPYDSFTPVLDFLTAAAADPDVLAIKQTLYRVGRNAPVVDALLEAAQRGKQVAVLVELKARFDEESNISWARVLEAEGVHVIYGLLGLKTHSKIALVVRKEGDHIRRYVHLATGNYNAVTAQAYTDLGLFTCDDAIGADASDIFNYLTGYSAKREYRRLLVAPIDLRQRLEALIRREMEHQKRRKRGHLIFQMNSLADKGVIRLLYEASQAGVRVDLFVRGICCLRPGLEGVSDHIGVTSIVGRFLEHSRIYYFGNGGRPEVYLGSADLMVRNLNRRVELLFPIDSPQLVGRIHDEILSTLLADNQRARRMLADGSYVRLAPGRGQAGVDSQKQFLAMRQAPEASPVLPYPNGQSML
jgi:polyphosphate kinase